MAQWRQIVLGVVIAVVAAGLTAAGLILYQRSASESQMTQTPVQAANPNALQHMRLEAQFMGPLKDTVIQRWQDPTDGTVCFIYLPIVVQHSPVTPTGFVQYGANHIGSISCLPPKP